jgi:hypothetical protein
MKSTTRIALLSAAALIPAFASAQSVYTMGALIINLINGVFVPLIFAIAFLVFIYGVAKAYIFSNGEPAKVSEGHKLIMWGLIGFFVMISVWGIVNVIANSAGLTGYVSQPLPTAPLQ